MWFTSVSKKTSAELNHTTLLYTTSYVGLIMVRISNFPGAQEDVNYRNLLSKVKVTAIGSVPCPSSSKEPPLSQEGWCPRWQHHTAHSDFRRSWSVSAHRLCPESCPPCAHEDRPSPGLVQRLQVHSGWVRDPAILYGLTRWQWTSLCS